VRAHRRSSRSLAVGGESIGTLETQTLEVENELARPRPPAMSSPPSLNAEGAVRRVPLTDQVSCVHRPGTEGSCCTSSAPRMTRSRDQPGGRLSATLPREPQPIVRPLGRASEPQFKVLETLPRPQSGTPASAGLRPPSRDGRNRRRVRPVPVRSGRPSHRPRGSDRTAEGAHRGPRPLGLVQALPMIRVAASRLALPRLRGYRRSERRRPWTASRPRWRGGPARRPRASWRGRAVSRPSCS